MQLDTRIQRLSGILEIGRSRDEVRVGYRSVHFGLHVIFYRVQGQTIDIVRVLHKRMDVERHL